MQWIGTRESHTPIKVILASCSVDLFLLVLTLYINGNFYRQLQELSSILGSLLTRGFPTSRTVPVDLIISLSSRLLSLPGSLEDELTLILPCLTVSFINLLTNLVDSCGDLLLPEAASINSLIVSGLTRKEKLPLAGMF